MLLRYLNFVFFWLTLDICGVKVAVGRKEILSVFGSDFDTLDGTGISNE